MSATTETPTPTPLSEADAQKMKELLDKAWSGEKVPDSACKTFYDSMNQKTFKPEELPGLRAQVTSLPENTPSDKKWKALGAMKVDFYENQSNPEALAQLHLQLKAALAEVEAIQHPEQITDTELEELPSYKGYLNGLIGRVQATREDLYLKNGRESVTAITTAFTSALSGKGYEFMNDLILKKGDSQALGMYRVHVVEGKLVVEVYRTNEAPETNANWAVIEAEAKKINANATTVLPQ